MFPLFDINRRRTFPVRTILIIVINIIVYAFVQPLLPDSFYLSPQKFLSMISVNPLNLTPWGLLFLSMWLHGNLYHLISNMWFLFIFGDNIEGDFGKFYIPFYLIGGMVAGLAHIYMMPQSAEFFVGASGAISAVMGAYLVFYPHAYIATLIFLIFFVTVVNIPAWFWLLIWFFQGNVLPTLLNSMSYVAYWAHIGGFVFGVIVAFMVLPIVRRRRRSEPYSTPYYW